MSKMEPVALQPFVDRLCMHSVLSDAEQTAILALPRRYMHVKAKRDFAYEDEASGHAFYIASGLAGRFSQTASGLRQITAFHIPGEMADLHSVVRPIGVGGLTALCETTVLSIPHSAIAEVAARYPAVAEAFWRDCMLDAAVLMQWVVNVGRRSAQTRLAHILCEMAIRMGRDHDVLPEYRLPVTQEQLGDAAALTSVHVNRSLKSLHNDGLATVIGGSVRIHDWYGLSRTAEFDPAYLIGHALAAPQVERVAVG